MDIQKITAEEIRGLDDSRRKEVELDIRRELNQIRLDVMGNTAASSARTKKLRRSLARVNTIKSEESVAKKQQEKSSKVRAK